MVEVLAKRSLGEVVAIQLVNSFFSAVVITELSRLAFLRFRSWRDKQHFTVVAIWCVLLMIVTTCGVLVMRRSFGIS